MTISLPLIRKDFERVMSFYLIPWEIDSLPVMMESKYLVERTKINDLECKIENS